MGGVCAWDGRGVREFKCSNCRCNARASLKASATLSREDYAVVHERNHKEIVARVGREKEGEQKSTRHSDALKARRTIHTFE